MADQAIEVRFDVVGMGNAIVDILSRCEDADLERLELRKGAMHLVDAERAGGIYQQIGPAIETSGGSACNTIAGLANIGLRTALIGKVASDQLGTIFTHDIRAVGTHFECKAYEGFEPTSRSFILVTPDGQRTMNTYLGAASHLGPQDVDEELVAASNIIFFEGYLWDKEPAKQAFLKASEIAHENGRKVAFSMSDVFCVEMHLAAFNRLIDENKIDILFGNIAEYEALLGVQGFDAIVNAIQSRCPHVVMTLGRGGAASVIDGKVTQVTSDPVDKVVDTTGAGDQFAAGYLAGLIKEVAEDKALAFGTICASEVITHMGPRPAENLKALGQARGIF